ncbi:MAG: Ig-like domain-containing protein [Pauljensenia sp.]
MKRALRVPSWLATGAACALVGVSALAGVVAADQSAQAAQIDAVTGAKITNTSTPAGPNYVYDNFKLELTFDTTGKTVAENDTLNIQLPSELRTRSASFDVTDTESGGVALRCTVPAGEGPEVTCVFTDFMATHVNARGNIVPVADSVKATTSEVLHATINHSVDIPMTLDHGSIVKDTRGFAPETAYKYGWQLHDGHPERFTWEVYIPERNIGENTIMINDTFDSSYGGYRLFNDESSENAWQRTRLLKWNSTEAYKKDPYHEHPSSRVKVGEAINGGTFTLTETSTGFVATFPNSNDDAIYELKYYTELKSPEGLKIGNSFNNTADVNGLTAKKEIEVETIGWGNVEGQLRTTPPTPTVTTPPATTVTPSPSVSTTEATPSPSTSTTPSPKTPLARTGVMTAPAIGLGVLGLALGAALMRRRQQA